jgi:hypothetical protein
LIQRAHLFRHEVFTSLLVCTQLRRLELGASYIRATCSWLTYRPNFFPNSKGKMTCTVRLQTSYVTIGRKKCREGPKSCNLATTLEEFYSTQYSIVREWSTNQILPSIWEGILDFCSFSNEGVISNSAIDRQRAFPSLYADHDLTTAFLHLRSPSDIWTHLRTPWVSPAHSKKLLKENLYWRCS